MSTHERIRRFNTARTSPGQNLSNDLAQAVVAGDTGCPRGRIGQDLDTGESVGVGDVAAQAEQAMADIAMLLDECGSRLEGIVKTTVCLTEFRYREPVHRTTGRRPEGVPYVSAGLVVSALTRPE